MISIGDDSKIYVHWVQNGIRNKRGFRSTKEAEQPRNVIDKETFFKEIRGLKTDINRLDRFFKEHAIVSLHRSLDEAVKEMKEYFHYQKEAVKRTEDIFKELRTELSRKFTSITTRDRVLSLEEAAKYLGASYNSVREKMLIGELPFFRVGNRYKVKENDLLKWIEDSRKKTKKVS